MGLNIRLSHFLYISADPAKAFSVEKQSSTWSNRINNPYTFSTAVIEHPFQIYSQIVENQKDKSIRLSVLIDYKSFMKFASKWASFSTVIRDSILCFPEINFYFDERPIDDSHGITNFLDFLIKDGCWFSIPPEIVESVDINMHTFNSEQPNDGGKAKRRRHPQADSGPYDELLIGKDNLFDASNIRFFLKELRYNELSLHRNYADIQKSRSKNLALCVEEERSQCLFNSLSLFLNGFRVLPVSSAGELYRANQQLHPQIILRDYDLQFADASDNWERLKKQYQLSDTSLAIHVIRGWRFDQTAKIWETKLNSNNLYWNKFIEAKTPTFYVSKGAQDKDGNRILFFDIPKTNDDNSQQFAKGVGKMELHLPGIYKPVSGVYTPFHVINMIRERYEDIYKINDGKLPIITSRTEEGGHGVPLDIYNIVKSMVDRAEGYYKNNRFVHSLIVANDAIEIMNGFHQALSIRAYRCLALAENAVSSNIIGGDEKELMRDTAFRLNKIELDVTRISSIGNIKDNLNIINRRNVLNQIYSEIRVNCKDKEHFFAENSVIRSIGHLNEGYSFSRIIQAFRNLHEQYLVRCNEELLFLTNVLAEKIKKEQTNLFLGTEEILIKNFKGHCMLNRHRRKYKRLCGEEWPCYHSKEIELASDHAQETDLEIPKIRVPEVELCSNIKLKLGLKHHGFSLFKRIMWQSRDSKIASFEGNTLYTHRPGSTLVIAKTRRGDEFCISIVVKEKPIENDETSNKE